MSNVITTNSTDIPLKEKQVIFDTAAKTISIDINGERIPLGSGSSTGSDDIINSDSSGGSGLEDVIVEVGYFFDDSGTTEIEGFDTLTVEGGKRYIITTTAHSVECVGSILVGDTTRECEIVLTDKSNEEGGVFWSLSFPDSLGWIGEPSFEQGKNYIINIRNNVAVAAEYTPGVEA